MNLANVPRRLLVLIALACLVETAAVSQTNFGQINGTVTDPSGTEISGATIVLHSLETSAERQVASNSTGSYVIPTVPPGRYSLTVTAPGFQTFKVSDFPLQSAEARTVDA